MAAAMDPARALPEPPQWLMVPARLERCGWESARGRDGAMGPQEVPQPSLERMVPFVGHSVLVGIVPDQDPLVVRTAALLAQSVGASHLDVAFVDTSRIVVEELPEGSVRHAPRDPDADTGDWRRTRDQLSAQVASALGQPVGSGSTVVPPASSPLDEDGAGAVPWRLWYLAGRPDRSLTHLARALDAAIIVVGTRGPGAREQVRDFLEGSVSVHLAHHQHRPVLTVPTRVVDWKDLPAPWTL